MKKMHYINFFGNSSAVTCLIEKLLLNANSPPTEIMLFSRSTLCILIDKMKNVVFGHTARNIVISGMCIEDMELKVNYDAIHPILLGMDVLKEFDIYIHKTVDNKTILLACPLYYVSEKYKQAVFGLMNQ